MDEFMGIKVGDVVTVYGYRYDKSRDLATVLGFQKASYSQSGVMVRVKFDSERIGTMSLDVAWLLVYREAKGLPL